MKLDGTKIYKFENKCNNTAIYMSCVCSTVLGEDTSNLLMIGSQFTGSIAWHIF